MHCSANIGPRRRHGIVLRPVRHGQDDPVGRPGAAADRRRRARLVATTACSTSRAAATPSASGCRAEGEPQIWNAIRFGSVLENVVLDPQSRAPDFDDDALTENTRAAYPVDFIDNARARGPRRPPEQRRLPDVRRLRRAAADRAADAGAGDVPFPVRLHGQGGGHRGGRDRAGGDVQHLLRAPRFCRCIPTRYAAHAEGEAARARRAGWLVNTGWTGGPYGVGERIKLAYTRAMVHAALDGSLDEVPFSPDPVFGVEVPVACPGVPPELLRPRRHLARPGGLRRACPCPGNPVPRELQELRRRGARGSTPGRPPGLV